MNVKLFLWMSGRFDDGNRRGAISGSGLALGFGRALIHEKSIKTRATIGVYEVRIHE